MAPTIVYRVEETDGLKGPFTSFAFRYHHNNLWYEQNCWGESMPGPYESNEPFDCTRPMTLDWVFGVAEVQQLYRWFPKLDTLLQLTIHGDKLFTVKKFEIPEFEQKSVLVGATQVAFVRQKSTVTNMELP